MDRHCNTTHCTIKIKNNIFAKEAALAAIPPKPNIAAIKAIIKNPTDQRNIKKILLVKDICSNN